MGVPSDGTVMGGRGVGLSGLKNDSAMWSRGSARRRGSQGLGEASGAAEATCGHAPPCLSGPGPFASHLRSRPARRTQATVGGCRWGTLRGAGWPGPCPRVQASFQAPVSPTHPLCAEGAAFLSFLYKSSSLSLGPPPWQGYRCRS